MLPLLTVSTALMLAVSQQPFRFEYSTRTGPDGEAYLVLRSPEAQEQLKIRVSGNDGSSFTRDLTVPAGGKFKIRWSQAASDVHYEVRFGRQKNPAFAFDVHRVQGTSSTGKLELLSSAQDLISGQKAQYRLPFAIIRYHNTIYGLDGQVLAENKSSGELSYAAGETLDLSWSTDQEVFLIKTRVEDVGGRYAEDTRAPWSFEVPHTDLVFDSGSSMIRPSETAKLDEAFAIVAHTLDRLDRASAAVRGSIPVSLYVIGHTDTVGSKSGNQRLSKARARSIARYFKRKGVWCGIEYAGMGEEGLAQPTADNVDNEANRRAVYILALGSPSGEGRPSPVDYQTLSTPRARTLAELPALPTSFSEHQNQKQAQGQPEAALARTKVEPDEPVLSAQGPETSQASERPQVGTSAPESAQDSPTSAPPRVPLQAQAAPGAHAKQKTCAVVPGSGKLAGWLWTGLLLVGFRRISRRRARQ